MANHEIFSGKVQAYRRTNKTSHCSASGAVICLGRWIGLKLQIGPQQMLG